MTAELGESKKLWGGVKFLDEMPYTATGKVSRKALREMAKALHNWTNLKVSFTKFLAMKTFVSISNLSGTENRVSFFMNIAVF